MLYMNLVKVFLCRNARGGREHKHEDYPPPGLVWPKTLSRVEYVLCVLCCYESNAIPPCTHCIQYASCWSRFYVVHTQFPQSLTSVSGSKRPLNLEMSRHMISAAVALLRSTRITSSSLGNGNPFLLPPELLIFYWMPRKRGNSSSGVFWGEHCWEELPLVICQYYDFEQGLPTLIWESR